MNVLRKICAIFGIVLLTTGVAFSSDLRKYTLNVNDFTALKVKDGINVDYVGDNSSSGTAQYTTTSELASMLVFTNNKGVLEIQLADNSVEYKDLPTITVSSKFLTKVENSGDSTIRVLKTFPMPEFKARLVGNGRLSVRDIEATTVIATIDSGNGTLTLSGKASTVKLNNTGAGTIQADRLVAKEVKCRQIGTGSIGCNAEKQLAMFGAGSGHIYYKGNPENINKKVIGIKVSAIEE